ncbi:MAG: hypothetical protein HC889_04035 [Synechococcaceae cyanobacterium SM1_2_3]|nr:hypothetical protein [Synechococcaceae cyanobacterium SM1_2_3]
MTQSQHLQIAACPMLAPPSTNGRGLDQTHVAHPMMNAAIASQNGLGRALGRMDMTH